MLQATVRSQAQGCFGLVGFWGGLIGGGFLWYWLAYAMADSNALLFLLGGPVVGLIAGWVLLTAIQLWLRPRPIK